MIDVPTLQGWLEKLGYDASPHGKSALRLRPRAAEAPPSARVRPGFYVQCSEHWVMLSMLPMLGPKEARPDDLGRRLLAANREMRVAKYALDKNDEVVLCAELPTESLDFPELADVVERMSQYAAAFREEIVKG
ncbi:MAG: CesT family type III secretion system chaperone [Minicystis sp.]